MTGGCCELDAVTSVAHRVVCGAIKTPGTSIGPKSWEYRAGFSVYSLVGEGNLSLVSVDFYLIVAALGLQSLPAQHLPSVDKPLRVTTGWTLTLLRAQPHLFVSYRNSQVLVSCGGVQAEATCIWNDEEKDVKIKSALWEYSCCWLGLHAVVEVFIMLTVCFSLIVKKCW